MKTFAVCLPSSTSTDSRLMPRRDDSKNLSGIGVALGASKLKKLGNTAKQQKLGNHGNLPGPGPGRPKGVPNKVNRDLKEAYLMAANLAGGKEGLVGYLKTQAELVNPSAFMTGLSKLLPSVLEGNPDAPLIVERVYYTRGEN
jgi:hypothetical protein